MPVSCPQAEAQQQPSPANETDSTDLQEVFCTPTREDGKVHSIAKSHLSLSSAQYLPPLHSTNKKAPLMSQQPSPPVPVQQYEM